MPLFNLSFFILGCVGGLLPDVLRIIKNRYRKNLPKYLKSANFWLGFVLLVAIGGFAAWILSANQAKEALIFGYAAPQLFSQLVAGALGEGTPPADRGVEDEEVITLRSWWTS